MFRINGTDYEMPSISSLTIDESIILYQYSSFTLDQLEDVEELNPGVLGGLLHVAIKRAEPEAREKDIRATVGKVNLMSLLVDAAASGGDASPPDQTPPTPTESSDEKETSSGPGAGGDSETSPAP